MKKQPADSASFELRVSLARVLAPALATLPASILTLSVLERPRRFSEDTSLARLILSPLPSLNIYQSLQIHNFGYHEGQKYTLE